MPQLIEVPGLGDVEFPDGMSDDDIAAAIRKNTEPSTASKVIGTVPKAAYALNKGIEGAVADIGAGAARFADPGPLRNTHRNFERAASDAAANWFDYSPRIDPVTLQESPGQMDPLSKAMSRLGKRQEQRRFQLRLPGEALEASARQEAQQFGALEEQTPGSKTIARGAEMGGGMLPLVATAAVPVIGPAASVVMGGAQTTGTVFNEAFAYYLKQGYSEEDARRQADAVALKAGTENAVVFAALPGAGNKIAARVLGNRLSERPIVQALARTGLAGAQAGTVMATDTTLRNVDAATTYKPEMTVGQGMKEALQAFGTGAVVGSVMHAPGELARMPKQSREADDLESDIGGGPIPPSRQLRNAPIITPPPESAGGPRTMTGIEEQLRQAPVVPRDPIAPLNRQLPKPAIVTPSPPNPNQPFHETIANVETLLRDLPVLPVEETMTPMQRRQALHAALSERQPVSAALLDRFNQDRGDAPFVLPEGYKQQGDQFVFEAAAKRLTPEQEMVRENQQAVAGLRGQPDENPSVVAPATPSEAIPPREPLVPVEVTAGDIKATKTRLAKRSPSAEKKVLAEDEARRELFEKAAFRESRPKTDAVPVQQLFVGDTFTLNGHRVRVREWVTDAETGKPAGVKLDGAYGDQFVPVEQTVRADEGTVKLESLVQREPALPKLVKPGFVPQKFEIRSPIQGPTGATIVGYEWRSTMGEKWSEREGGYVDARVSDWDNAGESKGTGRQIVHVFYVKHPDGTTSTEGIRSAQNVLGISETRLQTIAKREQAAQSHRANQEKVEAAIWEKAAKGTPSEAAQEYRKINHSPMRSFEENDAVFQQSALFEKAGRYIRRAGGATDTMVRNGWRLVEPDPAKPSSLDRADAALAARQAEIRKEGRLRALGDPEVAALAVARGAVKIAKGVRDFAKWSAEMLKEFGEAIRPHLQNIWKESHQVVNGDHPTIGLSERGIKTVGDEDLSSQVQDAVNPLYSKRSNETDTELARRLVSDVGGASRAAQSLMAGAFRDAPGSVQTILGSEIQRQLAHQERALRGQGKVSEADAIVQAQIRLAQADIARATDTAQALQAFQAHYANWSPAAWLSNFRKNVTRIAADRVSRVTKTDVPADPAAVSREIATDVANTIEAKQPKLGKIIREQYAGNGKPQSLEERLRENGSPADKIKPTAKKIESFYKRETDKWRKKHNIPEFDSATERDIIRRANAIEKLPEDSVQRRQAAQDLFSHLQKLKGFEWWELPMDFWYANILSGVTTHAKNILGNAVNVGSETAVQMLRNPTAIPQILEALGRALPKSAREAGSIIGTGRDTAGRQGTKFEMIGALERIQNPVISKLLLPWKLVGRFLKAEDAGFFYPLQEVKGVVLARRQAAAEGLPVFGGKRATRARSIMAWTAEARAKAEVQARQEGLSGSMFERRVDELREQARPPQLMENARDFAFLGTFNNEPYGILGALTDAWGHASERIPALKLVVPFTRIVANLSNSMLNWTPVGYWRGGRAQGYKLLVGRPDNTGKLFGKAVTDPTAIGDIYARSTLGTIALGGIAMAAGQYVFDHDPKFMVTGQGPTDPDQRDLLRDAGWIPYSVKVGDRYYSYQDKPLALPLSIVGHYLDAIRYRKLDQQDALNRVAYAVGAAGNVLLNSSWLQGLSSIFDQANRDSVKSPLKALPQQGLKVASSFVVPNAVKQIDRIFDDTKYTADDIRGMMLRETPFARRESLPDLNVFGETIHAPMSKLFWSKVEGGTLTQALAGRRLWPSVPVAGELTPREQYQLMRYRGPRLKAALTERLAEIQTLPHAEAQTLVESISRKETLKAKQALGLDEVSKLRGHVRSMKER